MLVVVPRWKLSAKDVKDGLSYFQAVFGVWWTRDEDAGKERGGVGGVEVDGWVGEGGDGGEGCRGEERIGSFFWSNGVS